MANGLFRRVSLGIAKESAYGTQATSPSYVLPNTELNFTEVVNQARNTSMLGSTYEVNDVRNTTQMLNFSFKTKVDENILPLLLLQKFSLATATVTGETTVYQHTLTYKNNSTTSSGESFTLFWDDPDRDDLRVGGARFESINLICDTNDFLYAEIAGRAQFPTTTGVTNTVATISREFVGRNVSFQMGSFGSSLGAQSLLTATFRHMFGLSDDAVNFELGSAEMTNLFLMANTFEADLSALYDTNVIKNLWSAGTKQKHFVTIQDTSRYVSGTAANTRPAITIDYPASYITNWTRDGGANDILKQNFTLTAVDDPSVATSPVEIKVTNNVATY